MAARWQSKPSPPSQSWRRVAPGESCPLCLEKLLPLTVIHSPGPAGCGRSPKQTRAKHSGEEQSPCEREWKQGKMQNSKKKRKREYNFAITVKKQTKLKEKTKTQTYSTHTERELVNNTQAFKTITPWSLKSESSVLRDRTVEVSVTVVCDNKVVV